MVVAVAFAVRWLFAVGMAIDVRATFLLDMSVYDMLARRLAAGEGYRTYLGTPAVFFPPGYPAILGVLYRIFGTSLVVAWTANAIFGALTCLVVYAMASRLFGRRVGLTAAVMLALFPSKVFLAAATLSEVTFGLAFATVLYLFVRWNDAAGAWRWVGFGALLGVSSLIRGVALPFLAVPAVVWALTGGTRLALRRTALAAGGLALIVFPWTVRNWVVVGAPIVLSTDGATALFIGHNPLAEGAETTEMLTFARRQWPWVERLASPQRDVEDATLKIRYALQWASSHPREELELIPKRLSHLYLRAFGIPANHRLRLSFGGRTLGGPELDPIVPIVADRYLHAVLLLAIVGLPFALRGSPSAAWVFPLVIAYFTLLHGVVFFGSPRYQASMLPALCVLAALGLHRVAGIRRP